MKKSKIILIILAAALLTALTAFAVSSADDVKMTFDKGTEDDVSGMPETGTIDGAYLVPDNVPEREGYEFLYWKLDYGAKTSYTVRYLIDGTDTDIVPPECMTDADAFSKVTAPARKLEGYQLADNQYKTVTLDVDPENNEIRFYYKKKASYTVIYVDYTTSNYIADYKVVNGVYEGDTITEYPIPVSDYTPLQNEITWQVTDGDVRVFIYYYSHQNEDS